MVEIHLLSLETRFVVQLCCEPICVIRWLAAFHTLAPSSRTLFWVSNRFCPLENELMKMLIYNVFLNSDYYQSPGRHILTVRFLFPSEFREQNIIAHPKFLSLFSFHSHALIAQDIFDHIMKPMPWLKFLIKWERDQSYHKR